MIKKTGAALMLTLGLTLSANAQNLSPQISSSESAAEPMRTTSNFERACIASIADSTTSIIGLAQPGIVESNPIIPSSIPFMLIAGVAKCGLAHYVDTSDLNDLNKTGILHLMDAVWLGAAANNVAVLLGASNPAGLVILTGVALYRWTQGAQERTHAALCTQLKAESPAHVCSPYVPVVRSAPETSTTAAAQDTPRP